MNVAKKKKDAPFNRVWSQLNPLCEGDITLWVYLNKIINIYKTNTATPENIRKYCKEIKGDLYVLCTQDVMESDNFGWCLSTKQERRCRLIAEEKGWIKCKRKGTNARRFIYILDKILQHTEVEDPVKQSCPGGQDQSCPGGQDAHNRSCPGGQTPYSTTYYIKELRGGESQKGDSHSPPEEETKVEEEPFKEITLNPPSRKTNKPNLPSRYKEWSLHLRKILHSRKPSIVVSRSSISKWITAFRLLEEDLKGNSSRIEKCLRIYEKFINKLEKPTIKDAMQFRKHYNWIEEKLLELFEEEDKLNRMY